MKTIVFMLSTSLIFAARASNQVAQGEVLSAIKCQTEVQKILTAHGSNSSWLRAIDNDRTKVYRTPTKVFGEWIELKYDQTQFPTLTMVNDSRFEVFTFKTNQCEAKGEITKSKRTDTFLQKGEKANYFTDADLGKAMKEHDTGMVYLWSPGMVYSMKEVETFRKTAKKLKLKMIEVMDPATSIDHAQKMTKQYNAKFLNLKNDSVELAMRNGMTHFPTTFVFSHGKLSHRSLIGVFDEKSLEAEIKTELAVLNLGVL